MVLEGLPDKSRSEEHAMWKVGLEQELQGRAGFILGLVSREGRLRSG